MILRLTFNERFSYLMRVDRHMVEARNDFLSRVNFTLCTKISTHNKTVVLFQGLNLNLHILERYVE